MSTKTATSGQARHSLLILEQQDLSADNYATLHDGYLADLAQAAKAGTLPDRQTFRDSLKLGPLMTNTFRFAVDHDRGLIAMIDDGHYDWKNADITPKRFPITGKGIVEYEGCLVHFNRDTESAANIKAIESADTANPWSAGKIEHLLAFGAKFPEEQRKYPIIGLGSVAKVSGNRNVPGLWGSRSKRNLYLPWFVDGWNVHCRFLAVRKVSAA
jgi:hypothetical protein